MNDNQPLDHDYHRNQLRERLLAQLRNIDKDQMMESNINSNENIYYEMQPTEYQNLNQAASNMIGGVTPFHQTTPYPYSYHHVNQISTQITTGENQEHQQLSQSEQQMNYSAATEHL
ncbi:unnamed protein product, partial [Didymodactylos carnosus]